MDIIILILPLFLVGFIYFTPSYIASKKNKYNKTFIYFLNFFLGWSLFGWLAALYLSLKKDQRDYLSGHNKGVRM